MSVELRIVIEGECTCGTPLEPGENPPEHHHRIECDWGRINNAAADPRYSIEHLMLTTDSYIKQLLESPSITFLRGTHSASVDGTRTFFHLDYEGRHWTWEVFAACWADGKGKPDGIMVGRWPD